MGHYVGMDLHSRNTYIGIIDESGKRIFKGKFCNDLSIILEVLKPFRDEITGIVIESTFNWYWLADGLMESGYKVHLANPCAIQQYKGMKHTNDQTDSFWLATMLKLGILPEGHIHPRPDRQLRDLFRKRLMLVQQRTQHILSFKSLMNRNLGEGISSNVIKTIDESAVDEMVSEPDLNLSARANIALMNFLNYRIGILEKEVLSKARLKPEFEKLMNVPGIGKSLALTIMLETGNIDRFKSVGNYASYCRCVPSQRLSNDKRKGQNNRKNGNKYLGWAFVEAAIFARRYHASARSYYEKKARKTKHVVAIKALGHKLARACYYIMKDQVDFDERKLFGAQSQGNKGCSSKPVGGLAKNQHALIGLTAATRTT